MSEQSLIRDCLVELVNERKPQASYWLQCQIREIEFGTAFWKTCIELGGSFAQIAAGVAMAMLGGSKIVPLTVFTVFASFHLRNAYREARRGDLS